MDFFKSSLDHAYFFLKSSLVSCLVHAYFFLKYSLAMLSPCLFFLKTSMHVDCDIQIQEVNYIFDFFIYLPFHDA